MKNINHIIALLIGFVLFSCEQNAEKEISNFEYYDIAELDINSEENLFAITDEDFLQLGSRVAYVNIIGDTILPFGKYNYLGTDTLKFFANIVLPKKEGSSGRWVGINHKGEILFDLVNFDNEPDYFQEGLTRVTRNGKMGFSNQYGQVVIPCIYDHAWWFKSGQAKVTYDANETRDKYDEHTIIESDQWFYIDRNGIEIK
jgi:hypothetical protein